MDKRTHCLMYNQCVSVTSISPLMTVDKLLQKVNESLPPPKTPIPNVQNCIAKAVRLSWMIEHLKFNPIMKPLLLHDENGRLITATGDTRLQALHFHPEVTHVPCLLSIPLDKLKQYPDWIMVEDNDHLAQLRNMRVKDVIVKDDMDWNYNLISWLELAIPEADGHLHDEKHRYDMFYDYYTKYVAAAGFPPVIDLNWLQQGRTWDGVLE
jgi:hypothetical protein